MGSILAIDYGLKRIGLAVSDPGRVFAFPCGVIENKDINYVISEIKKVISGKEIDLMIVGMPYNMDKSKSEMAKNVENFIKIIKEKLGLEVRAVDERLSSFTAEENLRDSNISSKKMKKYIDSEAARVILEEFLSIGIKSDL